MAKKKPTSKSASLTAVASSSSSASVAIMGIGDSLKVLFQSNREIMQALAAILAKSSALPSPCCIFISTLAVEDVQVKKPIPVTVEMEEHGSYIASFVDAGVSSGGDSMRNAVWSLQEMIASSYRMLATMKDNKLGPKMRREKAVLLEFLCQSSQKSTLKTPQKS